MKRKLSKNSKASKGSLFIIFMTVFIDLIGFGIIIPLLPYYAQSYGAAPLMIGLLMTAFSLMQFLFAPFWGKLSDSIGRRPVILLGLLGSALSYAVFASAPTLAWLFISRAFAGICGATITTSFAYISDVTNEKNRSKGMGLIGAAFGLGFIFGPALTAFFSQWGETTPIWIAAGICLANFLLAVVRLPESLSIKKKLSKKIRDWLPLNQLKHALGLPKISGLYFIVFMSVLSFSAMESTFALMGKEVFQFNLRTISYLFVYIGVVAAVVQGGLIGRLSHKYSEKQLMVSGQLLLALGVGLLPFAPNIFTLVLVVTVLSVGFAINNPSASSLISKLAPAAEKGLVLGGSQSMGSLARILGPLLGTYVFQHIGVSAPFVLGAVLLLITFLFTLTQITKTQAPSPR